MQLFLQVIYEILRINFWNKNLLFLGIHHINVADIIVEKCIE